MKKVIILVLISCFGLGCNLLDSDKMDSVIRSHIKIEDQEKEKTTKIDYLEVLSLESIPEKERKEADDAYRCKVYMKGTMSYWGSSRIYNINDTILYICDKSKSVIRREDTK